MGKKMRTQNTEIHFQLRDQIRSGTFLAVTVSNKDGFLTS